MTNTPSKGQGRARHARTKAKSDQRSPLPPRPDGPYSCTFKAGVCHHAACRP